MANDPADIDLLRELGFNQLEAEVYLLLLSGRPMTAYRVAKLLARPTANVYKAVDTLSRKGAVMVEEGDNRTCRAVPVGDFLHQAERDFRKSVRAAEERLSRLETPAEDDKVYRLESASRVFEVCREMLERRAEKIAVVDAFPAALEAIRESLERAAARGVSVLVEAYTEVEIAGAAVVTARVAADAPSQWRSEQLNVVVDGREHLMALLSSDLERVYQAVWSRSLYLSCVHHAGRLCEHTLLRLLEAAERGQDAAELLAILKQHGFFSTSEVPGQRELLARYTEPPEERQ